MQCLSVRHYAPGSSIVEGDELEMWFIRHPSGGRDPSGSDGHFGGSSVGLVSILMWLRELGGISKKRPSSPLYRVK